MWLTFEFLYKVSQSEARTLIMSCPYLRPVLLQIATAVVHYCDSATYREYAENGYTIISAGTQRMILINLTNIAPVERERCGSHCRQSSRYQANCDRFLSTEPARRQTTLWRWIELTYNFQEPCPKQLLELSSIASLLDRVRVEGLQFVSATLMLAKLDNILSLPF